MKLFFGFTISVLLLTSCSLNNAENAALKPSAFADDVDFSWDLWPELEENKPLKQQKLEEWPKLDPQSILFLGDESLQANWGLLILKAFTKAGQSPWLLSTCMSAKDFKSGGVSSCGFWSQPFEQDYLSATYLTVDQTPAGERLAPKIISDTKVTTVVISFGHRISVMESAQEIQQELASIELMAKWSHSAGKKCYVIEPRDALFLESDKKDFLTEDETEKLRIAVSYYCDWIDADILKNEFLQGTHISIDRILENKNQDSSEGYVPSTTPTLNPSTPPGPVVIPDPSVRDENRSDLALNRSMRPKSKPARISVVAQNALRERLKQANPAVGQRVVNRNSSVTPQFLWNGHSHGDELTSIGRKYLNNSVANYLKETQNIRDIENFCPNYWNLDQDGRENVWLFIYSALARFENDRFNPRAESKEKKSGRHSIGIFQVDTVNCGFGSDSNRAKLHDIDSNFKCALTRGALLVKNGRQLADGRYVTNSEGRRVYSDYGMDGYWSVLRKPYSGAVMNYSTGRFETAALGRRGQIINMTRAIRLCQ